MKRFAVIVLAAQSVFAAQFLTGQAARAVIGQSIFGSSLYPSPSEYDYSSDKVLGAASGLAYWNGALFVADSNRLSAAPINHRVLIYRNILGQIPEPTAAITGNGAERCPVCGFKADVVLGQEKMMFEIDESTKNEKIDYHLAQNGLRLPTAVATDGVRLVVADTDNNRVMIWNTIPQTNYANADLVIGQKDFTSGAPNAETGDVRVPSARSLRGPQGVWIQNNMLFVADTQNHRVLIWKTFPTQNFQPADLVLGQPSLSTATESDITKQTSDPTPTSLLNPVSVTSDGVRLFVSDLGHNRVLIWNSIPSQNTAAADIALGQPDLNSAIANNSYKILSYDATTGVTKREKVLCDSNGTDSNGDLAFPSLCARTMSFPRYALSDGTRLFVADGGNDRVLVFNTLPTASGAKADVVLGQISDTVVQTSDSSGNPDNMRRSAANAVRTPCSLAWDGTNLYVSEPYGRRILVFSPGASTFVLPVRNAASMEVFSVGGLTLSGTFAENDTVTITVAGKDYKYTIKKTDTLSSLTTALANLINAGSGDPNVLATALPTLFQITLTARQGGSAGDSVTLATASSNAALKVTATTMDGGGDAAKLAAGSLITIFGRHLTTETASAASVTQTLPTELGGVQVYVDGMLAPLLYVSPTQVNAQLPYEVLDSTSSTLWVRTKQADGSVIVSNAIGIPLIAANPGLFAEGGTDPRPAIMLHSSSGATGSILITGTAKAGDIATVKIETREYSYTVVENDTLNIIRNKLIEKINTDPKVMAYPAALFSRIRLRARKSGSSGNGIAYTATTAGATSGSTTSSASVVLSASSSALCCASTAGALVTKDNPAVPGETITAFGTGLGLLDSPATRSRVHTGMPYNGPTLNNPTEFVSSLAGGRTANVLSAGLLKGAIGIFSVDLELNTDLPSNDKTQIHIAQDVYTSNIVTFPVKSKAPTITSISPTSGKQGETLTITLTGTRFGAGPTCSFGAGITVNSCTYSSATSISAGITIASDAATGTRTITVTNTDGQSGKLTNGFTVNAK